MLIFLTEAAGTRNCKSSHLQWGATETLHGFMQQIGGGPIDEGWKLKSDISYHVFRIFAGFLSIFLLDGNLFRYQAVRGHHHIMLSKPAGQMDHLKGAVTMM